MKFKWPDIFKKWHFWVFTGILSFIKIFEDFIKSESVEYFLTGFPEIHLIMIIFSFINILIIYTIIWVVKKLFTKKKNT